MNSEPPVWLSPRMGGGWITSATAPPTFSRSVACKLRASAGARRPGSLRFDHSSRTTKAVAALAWLVELSTL